jgi:hypothetical protein
MNDLGLVISSIVIIPPLILLFCAPFIAFVLIVGEGWRKLTITNEEKYTPTFFPGFFETYFGVVWKSSGIAYGIVLLGVINLYIYILIFYFVLFSQIKKYINKNTKPLVANTYRSKNE